MKKLLVVLSLWLAVENAFAVELESMGKAVSGILGTSKAKTKQVNDSVDTVPVFFTSTGKPDKYVFVEKGIYPPSCTHTWVIGISAATGKVTEVRVNEMSCPHAFPTRTASFLDQFKGKGPADVATLEAKVNIVAKATGSSKLAATAVKRAITAYAKNKSGI